MTEGIWENIVVAVVILLSAGWLACRAYRALFKRAHKPEGCSGCALGKDCDADCAGGSPDNNVAGSRQQSEK
ncbi:MAG: hypothetical protein HGA80_03495 [Candidatus Omnitrophica bacterium]|nr:hypothetical protein [Candidatus Omnitrophota bacterium]